MRIVIVGAGVAGCIMARTLSQLPGAEVVCLERVAQGDHAESGTGLNIGPNARLALQAHDPALTGAITAAGLPWRTWRISLTDGTVLFDLPLSEVASNDGWRIRWSELYRVLREGQRQIQEGAHHYQRVELEAMAELAHHGWRPDYIAVRRRADLQPPSNGDPDLVILAAARLGRTRLIDNVEVTR